MKTNDRVILKKNIFGFDMYPERNHDPKEVLACAGREGRILTAYPTGAGFVDFGEFKILITNLEETVTKINTSKQIYKVIYHRYGNKEVEECETLEEAKHFCEYTTDSGEGFPEYILDKNDIIIYDGKEFVVGIEEESMIGQKYIFNN